MDYIRIYFKNGKEILESIEVDSLTWKENALMYINKEKISRWINLNEVIEIKMWEE